MFTCNRIASLVLVFVPTLCNASVIDSVFTTSTDTGVNGTVTSQTNGIGATVNHAITISDVDASFDNWGQYHYRVSNAVDAGTNTVQPWSLSVTTTDPSVNPGDYLNEVVFRLLTPTSSAAMVPLPTIVAGSGVAPAGWYVKLTLASRVVFKKSSGGVAGPATVSGFNFSVNTPDTSGGNSFVAQLAARNPEPGSMALAAVAMTVLGGGAARRRHKKKMKAQAEPEALAI